MNKRLFQDQSYRLSRLKQQCFGFSSSGLLMIIMPPFLSSLTTFVTARLASFSDLAPVQTIFPELKINVAVFGRLSLKTNPGNCSGRYSTPG